MIDWLLHTDEVLFRWINIGLANPVFDFILPYFRNKYFWIPFYVILIFVAFIKDRKVWILLILAALVILLTDTLSAQVVKPLFGRLRPCNEPGFKDSVRLLVDCGSGFSFISSHASNHFGLAILFIQYFRKWFPFKWLTFGFVIWAFTIAFSQIYVGVHYPFDVICGALLGMGLAYLVWLSYSIIIAAFFKSS